MVKKSVRISFLLLILAIALTVVLVIIAEDDEDESAMLEAPQTSVAWQLDANRENALMPFA